MGRGENKIVGKIGEDLAADLLKKKGYEVLERNWGSKWGEIDVIAKFKSTNHTNSQNIIVFVEVKTKIGEDFGSPEEMVNRKKLFQIQRMASVYSPPVDHLPGGGAFTWEVKRERSNLFQARIDVVAVVLNEDLSTKRINHYEAVY